MKWSLIRATTSTNAQLAGRILLGREIYGKSAVITSSHIYILYQHSLTNYRHHERTHVLGHTCDVCQAKFAWPKDLKRHLTKHSKEKQYICPSCSTPFSRQDNLLRHQRNNQHHFQQLPEPASNNGVVIECAGSEAGPSRAGSLNTTSSAKWQSQGNMRKRKMLAPNDEQQGDDDEMPPFPYVTPSRTTSRAKKRKLVCIFRRHDPTIHCRANTRYRTCEETGFSFISELRYVPLCATSRHILYENSNANDA